MTGTSSSTRWLQLVAAIALCPISALVAQGRTLLAFVHDSANVAVANAELSIAGTTVRSRTDTAGRAVLSGLPPEIVTLHVRLIGYAPEQASVDLAQADSVRVAIALRPSAFRLPDVTTVGTSTFPASHEFEVRRHRHTGGYFVTREQIDAHPASTFADVVARYISGVVVDRRLRAGNRVYSTRGSNSSRSRSCQVAVFINGIRATDGDAALLPVSEIGGIEYYPPGFVPAQYRVSDGIATKSASGGSAGCGVMLLWPRR